MFEDNLRRHYESGFDNRQDGRRGPVRRYGAVAISIPAPDAPSSRTSDRSAADADPCNDGIAWVALMAIRRVASAIAQWGRDARARWELHKLSDHALNDIGLRRESLDHEPVIRFRSVD